MLRRRCQTLAYGHRSHRYLVSLPIDCDVEDAQADDETMSRLAINRAIGKSGLSCIVDFTSKFSHQSFRSADANRVVLISDIDYEAASDCISPICRTTLVDRNRIIKCLIQYSSTEAQETGLISGDLFGYGLNETISVLLEDLEVKSHNRGLKCFLENRLLSILVARLLLRRSETYLCFQCI